MNGPQPNPPLPDGNLGRRLGRTPVAIVGLSALFPKSRDLRAFWGNVMTAADCIEEVPSSHWDVAEHYDADPAAPDKTYARRGGFIPSVPFDPMEFGLPPTTLEVTDVLQLLSLLVARDVLKDAGAERPWYRPDRTGVILGVTGANQLTQPLSARLQTPVLKEVVRSCGLTERDAEEIAEKFRLAFAPWEENSFPGMLGNVVAGRIANRLDLGGSNMTIDAACASSLAATKAAISELLEGRADTMITGGCDAENTIFMYLCFSKTPAFARSGRIRPFDRDADGTLIGEGIGMLALRRLADAERDGNRIYAVIRGIGSSSDGRCKSIYAPRKEGQMAALRRAYQDADCPPESVELFEAHGTGTAVGDATELSALTAVVSEGTEQRQFAAVGSVKSQIGHTKAAAGAAGMIKLALALHHRVLPPTINVDQPNPAIDFANSPFYVNTESRPWIRDPKRQRRRAAVSAFGFGGTNFHCVLEEHGEGDGPAVLFPVAQVHLWHAPDTVALLARLGGGAPDDGPVPASHARVALVARSAAELAELRALAEQELRAKPDAAAWSHPKGVYFGRRAAELGRVGALFAGQGSQYVNPGRGAVLALPPLRAAFDQANRHFGGAELLSRIVFPPPAFDDTTRRAQEEALRRTEYAQPSIGALSAGQYRYLTELGFAANGYLGHSFGELTALWAAGALNDEDFFALARARGAAMAPPDQPGFDPGAMAAVTATEQQVGELLAGQDGLFVCNRNAPTQIVLGGGTEAVDRLVAAAQAKGLRISRLPVSAAFHTPYVAHAVEAFRARLAAVEMCEPQGTVFANTPGGAYGSDPAANRRLLAEQMVNPVHFADRVEEMYAGGFRTFVEFGPNGVLTQLVHQILVDRPHHAVRLDGGPGVDADLALKRAVAQLAVLGLPLAVRDRYAAAVPEAAPAKPGMTVLLNGINYVSDSRRAAYREALEHGYRVARPEAAPVVPAAAPVVASGSVPERMSGLIAGHLALHDEYLNGQAQSAQRLAGLLENAAAQGRLDDILPGLTAVKEHGLAIGRTHLRANEILRDLAALEFGAAPAQAPVVAVQEVMPAPVVPQSEVAQQAAAPADAAAEDAAAVVLAVVAQKTGYPVEMLELGMDVEADLGIDSIKRVEILGVLSERFPGRAQLGPEQLGELRTLGKIVAFLTGPATSAECRVPEPRTQEAPRPESAPFGRAQAALAELPHPDRWVDAYPDGSTALLVDDGGELTPLVAERLRATGWRVRVLRLPSVERCIDGVEDHALTGWSVTELAEAITAAPVRLALFLATRRDTDWSDGVRRLSHALLAAKYLVAPLAGAAPQGRAAFVTVTALDGAFGLTGVDAALVPAGGFGGLVKSLAVEAPELFCRALDLVPGLEGAAAADLVLEELYDACPEPVQVGRDGSRRVALTLGEHPSAPETADTAELSAEDLLVVTGGGRGITARCAVALAAAYRPGLLLLGRTELTAEPDWARGVTATAELKAAAAAHLASAGEKPTPQRVEQLYQAVAGRREVEQTLAEIRAAGSEAEYLEVDITDAAATAAVLAPYADRVTGLVHGAGALADQLIANKCAAEVDRVFGPKLGGLRSVVEALPAERLRQVLLFSSVAGFFGNRGQSDYAMANEVLNAWASSFKRRHPAARVTALNWGAWDGGMVSPQLKAVFRERGITLIPENVGTALFTGQFTPERGHDVVTVLGPTTPLSAREATALTATVLERPIAALADEPLVADHVIGGVPVLPAAVVLGWMVGAVERIGGGTVREVRDFTVLKGVLFDGSEPDRLQLAVAPAGRPDTAELVIRSAGADGTVRPHYAASVVLGAELPQPVLAGLPALGQGREAACFYRDGTLFHGSSLQGICRVLAEDESRLVLACEPVPHRPAGDAFAGRHYAPGVVDLLLQAGLVWLRLFRGVAGLPLSVAQAELYQAVPDRAPFLAVVEPVAVTGDSARLTVTAVDQHGRALLRLTGLGLVSTPQLAAKFAAR